LEKRSSSGHAIPPQIQLARESACGLLAKTDEV
jgi:hypothetical protein